MTAAREVAAGLIVPGDVIRIPGGRAAEVQYARRDEGIGSFVSLTYVECKSGERGDQAVRSDEAVTLLRSSGLRAA